ncbi:response regulator transcription factor [Heliorestis acidaminivorans]|uniref:Stage 0 sporulation protein A homolog n=1 Tax=Heliorestis acidaminivorans TaxID=553427 RepID=A0A6I0EV19_9FIRM|nr:response regulator transcription factor [Heliorestis acidaminivorans]KAB2954214.1 response regulator transcription factor [Heliorestis acidaminivorans]
MKKILIVDDEEEIVELLSDYLSVEGYSIVTAYNGEEALNKGQVEKPDLAILDIMMPQLDGFEVCRILRKDSNIPILIISARQEESDKILALGLGADDYLVKPFSPREVVARVKALLRRATVLSGAQQEQDILRFTGLEIYLKEYRVVREGQEISLQAKEFELLRLLATHPRQVFTKEQLMDRLWSGDYYGDPNALSVYVRRLREKIESNPAQPRYIKTVWGVGYKFAGDSS